ncbi:hypothetical protein [Novosphingobium sp.]|uniref:hypothetical protein n=1 Tax=Novosphingobium sp. TaxID=1874826 RepID=UPI002FDCB33F
MPPRPAPAHFPYAHGSLAQNDTRDPRAWHLANKAKFDALYPIPDERTGRCVHPKDRAAGLAAARQWRIDNKARFDALYGPESRDDA